MALIRNKQPKNDVKWILWTSVKTDFHFLAFNMFETDLYLQLPDALSSYEVLLSLEQTVLDYHSYDF
jgi:hypothetical protein